MALTISVEKVSDDQFFLMNGIEVVGMVVAKEAVADKIVELHLNMDYQK